MSKPKLIVLGDTTYMTSWKNNNTLESRRLVEEVLNPTERSEKTVAKDRAHLRRLIKQRIELYGPNCDLNDIDVSQVTDMTFLFRYKPFNLFNGDISQWDVSNVRDMWGMFYGCKSLTTLDLSSFNTSRVDNMCDMFENCSGLTTLDLSNFDTSNVELMNSMFSNCSNLKIIKGVIDMKSCTNCYDMFKNCINLRDVKIKNPPDDFVESGLTSSQYTIVY